MKILIVEDEPKTGDYLRQGLREAGFGVELASDGLAGLQLAQQQDFDLLILDVMLPGLNGWQLLQRLREQGHQVPVLFLSARDQVEDRVKGLELGADDYLVKPFSPRELVARARAMLRRPRTFDSHTNSHPETPSQPLRIGSLTVDSLARRVQVNDFDLDLTRTEFDLLAVMCANPRQVFSRRQLIDAVWGPDWFGDEHLVDVHVGHVRRKLGDDAAEPKWIRTVRGVGYGMVA